jgi:hypothetical protein
LRSHLAAAGVHLRDARADQILDFTRGLGRARLGRNPAGIKSLGEPGNVGTATAPSI